LGQEPYEQNQGDIEATAVVALTTPESR
jgi:hypothetical protein